MLRARESLVSVWPAAVFLAAIHFPISAAAQTRHPRAELIERPRGASAILQVHPAQVRAGREFASIARRLRNLKQVGEFGVLDGSAEEVIGGVTAAGINASNRVYILDEQNSRVNVLSPQGSLLATIGRSGRGPQEFFHPRALAVTASGTIHVADLTQRMQIWRQSGSGWTYVEPAYAIPNELRSACSVGQHLVVNAFSMTDSLVLRLLGRTWEQSARFGQVYRTANPRIRAEANGGRIACVQPPNGEPRVFWSGTLLNNVRAYTISGRPMWVTELAGKMPPNVEENASGGLTVRIEESGFQRVESLLALGNEYLLLQLALFTAENRREKEPYERLDSFILRVSDGRGEWIGRQLPRIVAATGEVLVAAEHEPFPRVVIHRY